MMADPLQTSYDRVAADYTAHIADELAGKPLDRALLLAFAEQVRPLGPVADLGCGPGHVAAFLADAGVTVEGIDYSRGMVAQAAQRYPTLTFRQGDLRVPDVAEASLGGMVAFYSSIHLPPDALVPTFRHGGEHSARRAWCWSPSISARACATSQRGGGIRSIWHSASCPSRR